MDYRDLPVQRHAPRALLAELESIEPRTRLVYAGDGRWWLFTQYDRTDPLYAETVRSGIAMLDGMASLDGLRAGRRRRADMVLRALCKLCGLYWQHEYVLQGEPTSRIANHWRLAVWTKHHAEEATWAAIEDEISGDAKIRRARALASEAARAEAGTAHRLAFRKPVTVQMPGAVPTPA